MRHTHARNRQACWERLQRWEVRGTDECGCWVLGGDGKTFEELKRQGVLNRHGRVTDVLTREDFVLDADNKLDAAVKKAEVRGNNMAHESGTHRSGLEQSSLSLHVTRCG